MELEQITPLLLTYNESANLKATLSALTWAKQIVIIDSGSTDGSLEIAQQFPQVAVYHRQFDHFADQCNYGLTKVQTPWTLSLDADYQCSLELVQEIAQLDCKDYAGFQCAFQYCVYSRALRGSLYPPRTVLYKTQQGQYHRDGHAHRVHLQGKLGRLKNKIAHDDHKELSGWFSSQIKYAILEAEKLSSCNSRLGWKDRLRKKIVLAPVLTLFYCLFAKGLVLDGRAGWYYTSQRVLAELMLSLALLDRSLRSRPPRPAADPPRGRVAS